MTPTTLSPTLGLLARPYFPYRVRHAWSRAALNRVATGEPRRIPGGKGRGTDAPLAPLSFADIMRLMRKAYV